MPRPKKCRRVCSLPKTDAFKAPSRHSSSVNITIDEYETIRLIDNLGLTQKECAKQMDVARSTITSIYEEARKKIADAVVNGKGLTIGGGDIELCRNCKSCCGSCGKNKCGRCNHGACEKCTGNCIESQKRCNVA
ncbi:MAG: DUF134 domain-containing protein [Eubacterium sp.]